MGFFSGLRRKVKKLIPKEIRPFVPYIASSFIPGAGAGIMKGISGIFLTAAAAKGLTDDEADLKDIARTGIFAAAPTAISQGAGNLATNFASKGNDVNKFKFLKGVEKFGAPEGFMSNAKMIGAQGATDAAIKQVELNEDALAKYNADLARQGINDKAGRRAAIRAIYEGTGTWDMDEVDGMLDTYGYRTGGRVGYAMGDFVDTDQIIEDVQDYTVPGIVGKAAQGIGNLVSNNRDKVDMIIDKIISLTPGGSAVEIIKVLVERYGVDPEVAQRKIINRMSDANEGFGPQGLDGTPDDGYNPNIGIDSGAEDYYGETPAMPENLGDMGGNMDDMSGNSILNRLNRGEQYEEEVMPDEDRRPKQIPDPIPDTIPNYDRMPMPFPKEGMPDYELLMNRNREDYMNGGRAGYDNGGISTKGEDQDAIDIDVDGILSMKDLVEATIRNKDDEYEEFDDSLTYAKKGYDMLYPELENQPIRELRLADGGSVEDKLIERVKELQDEGMDFASAMAQAMKEDMAENKARGGIMNGMGVNIQEQIAPERMMAANGGLMSMGGNEMDLRGGGFVPMGKAERADDVPARLSKNEFVMTADAVRAAGGGSVQKGADLMYDQMKQLEGQA